MLKATESYADLNNLRALGALKSLLQQVPAIHVINLAPATSPHDASIDLYAHITVNGHPHALVCQVKASGQPRYVHHALLELRSHIDRSEPGATPLLIAPYLSPEAQAMCREQGIGFLDLEGNTRLVFDNIFIERQVPGKPPAVRREIRSIFKPKSARVLRVLLHDPRRAWRVTDLAHAATVSVGHVSNVRVALLDREWARLDPDGISLNKPDALLDAWRDAYAPPKGERLSFYTTLHGTAFDKVLRTVLGAARKDGNAMLASFSAAQWLSPYARVGTHYLYADQLGLDKLRDVLKLSSPIRGENVIITRLHDPDLFRDAVDPAPGIACTSLIQTYLDLTQAGERGREAADYLRHERLKWPL